METNGVFSLDISGTDQNIVIKVDTLSDDDDGNIETITNDLFNESDDEFSFSSLMEDNNIMAIGSEPSDTDSQGTIYNRIPYKKLSFCDVQKIINDHYEQDTVHRYSSAMDILASYLKGQKIIYMESRIYCTRMLNMLMFPSIALTCIASVGQEQFYVLSTADETKKSKWGSFLLSAINVYEFIGIEYNSFIELILNLLSSLIDCN